MAMEGGCNEDRAAGAAVAAGGDDGDSNFHNNNKMIHAHPAIVQFLLLHCDDTKMNHHDHDHDHDDDDDGVTQKIVWYSIDEVHFPKVLDAPLSCEDLITLALQCDNLLYPKSPQSSSPSSSSSSPSSTVHINDHETTIPHLFEHAASRTTTTTTTTTPTPTLIRLGQRNDFAVNAVATLLALNQLESIIRRRMHYATGKAPLLKTMIVELGKQQRPRQHDHCDTHTCTNLSFLLQGLLLPAGLNLRNILWHGFCGGVSRPWLSLVVCCIETLRKDDNQSTRTGSSRSTHCATIHLGRLSDLVKQCKRKEGGIRESLILNWLPESHHALWHLACQWLLLSRNDKDDDHGGDDHDGYPACSIAILSVLLEHGLRLAWCEANDRWEDSIAQPDRFYVTLDGHGQRHIHDLFLHPYLVNGVPVEGSSYRRCRNALLQRLGGSVTALLTDLFCSADGPNIRATLAHGLWDEYLNDELVRMGTMMGESDNGNTSGKTSSTLERHRHDDGNSNNPHFLHDYAWTILMAMEAAARACSDDDPSRQNTLAYRPRFSCTATTRQSLVDCQRDLQKLLQLQGGCNRHSKLDAEYDDTLPTFFAELCIPWTWLDVSLSDMIRQLNCGTPSCSHTAGSSIRDSWTVEQIYEEYDLNQLLAPLGATQQLARDIADAVTKLNTELEEANDALHKDSDNNLSTRQRRRYTRILTLGTPGAIFYGFATMIVLLSLQDVIQGTPPRWEAKDSLKVVERTRMVVSTVSTHLTTNSERAYKSIEAYCKGKIIKQMFPLVQHFSK